MLRVTLRRINRRLSSRAHNHPVGRLYGSRHRLSPMGYHNNHLWIIDGCWSTILNQSQTLSPSLFLSSDSTAFYLTVRTDSLMVPLGQRYSGEEPKNNQTDHEQIKK